VYGILDPRDGNASVRVSATFPRFCNIMPDVHVTKVADKEWKLSLGLDAKEDEILTY
jgi:hypothetical protein